MQEAEFREWLLAGGAQTEAGRNSRIHAVRTIERKLSELGSPFTTLADAWGNDHFQHLRERIRQMRQDAREGGQDFRILMPESQKPLNRLSNWNSWLLQYGRFLAGEKHGTAKDADRIRQYVLEHYIEPARDDGHDSVEVLVSDVNRALGLNQAWPNICQALAGKMFQELAEVPAPDRIGADQSSATVFRFRLDGSAIAAGGERPFVLFDRDGAAFKPVRNFNRSNGRSAFRVKPAGASNRAEEARGLDTVAEVARAMLVEGLPARVQSVNGGPVNYVGYGKRNLVRYQLDPVIAQEIGVPATGSVLAESSIDRKVLELLRERFISDFPDFSTFAATSSAFHRQEDLYKRDLIQKVQDALAQAEDDEALGGTVLDLILDRSTNLIGNWRTYDHLIGVRQANRQALDGATGTLARSKDFPGLAIEAFLNTAWPLISAGQEASMPYGDSRILPTLILALARPNQAIAVRYTPFNNAALMLLGHSAFANAPLSAQEFEDMIALARAIESIMQHDWGWKPRDLWDVQGFIWVTCQKRLAAEELAPNRTSSIGEQIVQPTNMILFGPPGTGKTYATAEEALRLCGEPIPADRGELMESYHRLAEAGRIEFVTFHQNYAYEEFVEGLRPVQKEEDSAGFQLQPELGVFRRIARRAETSTGSSDAAFSIGDRQVFKMSIGRANDPEDAPLFEEAIENGYSLLGFDDLDWSDERYSNRDEIISRLKAEGTREGEITAYAGRVQSPDMFRNWMKRGDLIIVSKGNSLFRAIGEVVGDYEFNPRPDGTYAHRRLVRWLWIDRAGVPVEEIYSSKFMMKTIYVLTKAELNLPALERYVESQREGAGEPDQFVLIVDEINRANISKVLGELITLLEPDKRIGGANELRIRLPYSRDLFGVPSNLHIIGTMNTADRSIALLDTALRRRFQFKELTPTPELLDDAQQSSGIALVPFLRAINDRIEYLLDREHRIGHAFFINCREPDEIHARMRDAVIPLLQEYFFEDLDRVAAVLGEGDKGGNFLGCRKIPDPFGDGEPRKSWYVLPAFDVGAYDRCITSRRQMELVEGDETEESEAAE